MTTSKALSPQGYAREPALKDIHCQTPQLVRHEILSLLIAWEFRKWLSEADGHFETALIAGGGHHLKLGGKAGKQLDYIDDTVVRPCGDSSLALVLIPS